MVKGEIKIPDGALNLQPLNLRVDAEKKLLEEAKINNLIIEELNIVNIDLRTRYSRLKRRVRSRSSNIL